MEAHKIDCLCRTCVRIRQGYCDGAEPDDLNRPCEFYKRMTNADRIRNMKDDDLAYLIAHRDCPDGHFWGDSNCCGCVKCWLDWLKQEVAE